MFKYLPVVISPMRHDRGTYLAEAHAMAPSSSGKGQLVSVPFKVESRTLEMSL